MKNMQDNQDQLQRRKDVEEVLANAIIEGYSPTESELLEWERYIDGSQTLKTTTANLQRLA